MSENEPEEPQSEETDEEDETDGEPPHGGPDDEPRPLASI
jgi:hypothetical protein